MRVLVCGGRDFTDGDFVDWVLDTLHAKKPITIVIHGCARGADTFGENWAARQDGVTSYGVPADWKKHGSRAGPVRNRLMLELGKPQLVVAFEGGAGTRDMTSAATAAGVKVVFAEKLRAHSPFANSERVWMYKDSSHPDREMGYGVWMYKDWGMGSGAWYKGR